LIFSLIIGKSIGRKKTGWDGGLEQRSFVTDGILAIQMAAFPTTNGYTWLTALSADEIELGAYYHLG